MPFRFLLDEQVEPGVGDHLERDGHDIVHVRDVSELGPGSSDPEVAAHSKRTGRYVLTNDDDFFDEIDDELPTVFYFPDQRLSAYRIASIVGVIDDQYTRVEVDRQPFVHVVEGWL